MSAEYPDVLGDLVEARQRFEVNGIHYVAALRPATVAPGVPSALRVWLQSCWDVPTDVSVRVHLPTQPLPALSVIQVQTDVPLGPAEVGELTIPIATATETVPGCYPISVTIGARCQARGFYIRSQKSSGQFSDPLLAFTTGTGLAPVLGLEFIARTAPQQQLHLQVEGAPEPVPTQDPTPTFLSYWTVADLPVQGKAQQYVNDQRIYLAPKLVRQPLFRALFEESQARCRNAGLPLQIGEALFLAKILTFTTEHFLARLEHQDAILVPTYTLAFRSGLSVSDPVGLIARADYPRLARLAISISFGLVRMHLGRDPWTLEEQLALADLVAERFERGGILPAEFLYLPLLLGGLLVAKQIQLPDENLAQSLGLLAKARQQRAMDLADNPELCAILDRLLLCKPATG